MRYAVLFILIILLSSCSALKNPGSDRIKAENSDKSEFSRFDNGKLWTFEHFPYQYFDSVYSFRPTEMWLDSVKQASLLFADWCSGSFVSEEGLILTNHHCIDFIVTSVQNEGEDLLKTGFYAPSRELERKVPDLFVDQLLFTSDITDEINKKINESPKKSVDVIIAETELAYSDSTGHLCRITPLYNGGLFSLYCYKRYEDVRLVFSLESDIGLFGGDPDNFTYPRYNLDFSFLRAYENDKPAKTNIYFKWRPGGAIENTPLFVIGRPGSTERFKTMAQLEYDRAIHLRNMSWLSGRMTSYFLEAMELRPEQKETLNSFYLMVSNSAKVYEGEYAAINDSDLLARKEAFENLLRNKVADDQDLSEKYSGIWEDIEKINEKKMELGPKLSIFSINEGIIPRFCIRAREFITLALNFYSDNDQLKPTEEIKKEIDLLLNEKIDMELEKKKIELLAGYIYLNLGEELAIPARMFGGRKESEAADYALSNTILTDPEKMLDILLSGKEVLLDYPDPFITYIMEATDFLNENSDFMDELIMREEELEKQLGNIVYDVFGTVLPPDATATIRISDGMLKSYEYNGTVAPLKTTFYGLYNRHYSFNMKYPWKLTDKWLNPAAEPDLSTPINFISTHDITGGSSGSPVINRERELVGLAFDGNIESLAGNFLFDPESNRMVSVTAEGILEAISKIYGASSLVNEIRAGKLAD